MRFWLWEDEAPQVSSTKRTRTSSSAHAPRIPARQGCDVGNTLNTLLFEAGRKVLRTPLMQWAADELRNPLNVQRFPGLVLRR